MKNWLDRLKRIRGMPFILLGLILGMILMIVPHTKTQPVSGDIGGNGEMLAYSAEMEHKIAQMTEGLVGSGDIRVLVTAECSQETIYASEHTESSGGNTDRYLLASGSQPVPLRIITPKIRGIAVICPGGGDARVQMQLIAMLTAAFGVPAGHIYIGGPTAIR
ncbi:MAG: hypothetical protein MJ175_13260 [Clostridia bacterium]|nr:hypothetical protein [Clostridia bacterium]